jgi:hypothetical protein
MSYEFMPSILIGNLTEIPSDFLTGLLTFDGIMVAVFALSFSSRSTVDGDQRWLSTLLSTPFLLSAIFSLYSLLRLHVGTYGELASFVGMADRDAISATTLGVVLWFCLMFGYRFVLRDEDTTTPSGTPKETTE